MAESSDFFQLIDFVAGNLYSTLNCHVMIVCEQLIFVGFSKFGEDGLIELVDLDLRLISNEENTIPVGP
jgi:hypothetical protein